MNPELITSRLELRPPRRDDAPRLQSLCGNWKVARMLEAVPHPYPDGLAESFIADQTAQRESGEAFVFAIALAEDAADAPAGELIGVIGLERGGDGIYAVGYWLGEPWWGRGYISEAAKRVIQFAFEDLRVEKLRSAHFADNPASGRILRKCGFGNPQRGTMTCRSRGEEVDAVFLELLAESAKRGDAA